MELTPLRWCAVVTTACAAAFVTLLPLSKRPAATWVAAQPAPLEAALADLADATAETYAAVRDYRAARGIERWSAAYAARRDTTAVRLDVSVTPVVASAVREAALGAWTTLGPGASAAHAEVFVYADSTEIPRAPTAATTAASRRPLEPRRLVDVAFAFPEAAGGNRCVVLVRLRGTTPEHVAALRDAPLDGVCAFFATFGLPGTAIRSWLTAGGYAFARRSDWDVPRAPATDAGAVYSLNADAAHCLTGSLDRCRAVFAPESARIRAGTAGSAGEHGLPARQGVAAVPPLSADRHHRRLGREEGRMLADAVRDLGPERFARFWRSDASAAEAFEAAAGMPLEAWTRRWLVRTYGNTRGHPVPRPADLLWLAATLPALLVVAARPRERLLVERLRDRR